MSITGPHYRVVANFSKFHHEISTYRQSAPYRLRLNWYAKREECEYIPGSVIADGQSNFTPNAWSFSPYDASPVRVYALQRAYGSFRDEVRSQISVAANLAERKQSIDMIAKRSLQIFNFVRHVANFRWAQAGKSIGLTFKRVRRSGNKRLYTFKRNSDGLEFEIKLKKGAKWFGNNYLEFHFGWEPLMKDIHEGLEILVTPVFKKRTVRSRATETLYPRNSSWVNYKVETLVEWRTSVQLIGDVTIDDPSAYSLNQMGIVNPLSVLWEVIPFSFIVDWFTNVSDLIGSLTDFLGCQVDNTATTTRNKITETKYYMYRTGGQNLIMPNNRRKTIATKRGLGLELPPLSFKRVKLPSVTRAATAVSLLTLALKAK